MRRDVRGRRSARWCPGGSQVDPGAAGPHYVSARLRLGRYQVNGGRCADAWKL
jgi:hypothetical protein